MLAALEAAGIEVTTNPDWDMPGVGRFARIHDPEGNRVELWEPDVDHSPQLKPGGFLGCSQRTRPAHSKVKRCDRLTRAVRTWVSSSLHRRTFPQALRYGTQSTTRRARAPFIPSPEGRGLLAEKDNTVGIVSKRQVVVLSVRLAAPDGVRRFIPRAKARGLRAAFLITCRPALSARPKHLP